MSGSGKAVIIFLGACGLLAFVSTQKAVYHETSDSRTAAAEPAAGAATIPAAAVAATPPVRPVPDKNGMALLKYLVDDDFRSHFKQDGKSLFKWDATTQQADVDSDLENWFADGVRPAFLKPGAAGQSDPDAWLFAAYWAGCMVDSKRDLAADADGNLVLTTVGARRWGHALAEAFSGDSGFRQAFAQWQPFLGLSPLKPPSGKHVDLKAAEETMQSASRITRNPIPVSRLISTYQTNEILGDTTYRGKRLAVGGQVTSISKDFLDHPYLAIGADFFGAQAHFSKDREGELMNLSPGMNVVLSCTAKGFVVRTVQLDDCELEPYPKPVAQTAEAVPPAQP